MLADTVVDMIFLCSTKPSLDYFFFLMPVLLCLLEKRMFPLHPAIDTALPRKKEPAADAAGLVRQASTMH